jgi:hypothetical protein
MPAPGQTFERLTPADEDRLRQQRAVIERYLGDDSADHAKYATAPGKLGLLRAVLAAKVFNASQTYELQCMGVVLGDAFVQQCGWRWRMANDQHGRDPCVKVPDSSIVLFPLTMISKRVERGDEVDVFRLFNEVAANVEHRVKLADPLAD